MTGDQPSVLCAAGLTKSYGRTTVLKSLDFELQPGEVTVLLGANATGKSTLMRLALGTLESNAGTLEVLGRDPIRQQGEVLQRVGYVPSVPDVYDWMRPDDLFRFLRPQYLTWNESLCTELSERLQLPGGTTFGKMSRGQGMKTMLVAALAHQPELLLLDEPFAGLDPLVRDEVLHGVISTLRAEACTVLCATHDLEITSRIADRVAILADGRISRHGPLEAILATQNPIPVGLKEALLADSRPATAPEAVTQP